MSLPATETTAESADAERARAGDGRPWTLLVLAASLAVACAGVVLAIRLREVIRHGDLYAVSGVEATPIYAIWKAQRGYPVYERIGENSLAPNLYNYLFYRSYAWLLKAAGITGPGIVLAGRMLTMAIAAAGALASWALMRRLVGRPLAAGASAFLGLMAFLIWFGTGSTSWFVMAVRPDILALALGIAGLWLYHESFARGSIALAFAASLAFYVAWATKQSMVATVSGVSLHALLCVRDLRRAAALIVPCLASMIATLVLGGDDYRYNILHFANSVPLAPRLAVRFFAENVAGQLFLWVTLTVALAVGLRRRPAGWRTWDLGPLAFAWAVAVPWAFLTSGRIGSTKNHLMEMIALGTMLASVLLVRARRGDGAFAGRRAGAIAALLVASMAAMPLAQLVFFDRLGRLTLATDVQHAAKSAVAEAMKGLPRPILARDEMLGLPWYSSGGRYPAYVLDLVIYDEPLMESFLDRGFIRTLVITDWDPLYRPALRAGYAPVPGAPGPGPDSEWIILSSPAWRMANGK